MMQQNQALRFNNVVSLDALAFARACADLMAVVTDGGRPDALVAIPSGGLHVAHAMAEAMPHGMPILSLTCRRPTTQYKNNLAALKKLVAGLPRPIADRLRVWEHAFLARRPPSGELPPYRFDEAELARLDEWLAQAGPAPSLVVVDDAVDSGATMLRVVQAIQSRLPGARVRSAAVTVTTARPLIQPDHALYQRQLCRFPWSLDA
jgi:phosphoribosylpyrophosphate synthetase